MRAPEWGVLRAGSVRGRLPTLQNRLPTFTGLGKLRVHPRVSTTQRKRFAWLLGCWAVGYQIPSSSFNLDPSDIKPGISETVSIDEAFDGPGPGPFLALDQLLSLAELAHPSLCP